MGLPVAVVPALNPDVAFLYVHKTDVYGDARIFWTILFALEAAMSSRRVIVSAEQRRDGMPRTVEFTDTEFMIAQGARLLENGRTFLLGWGLPQVVAIRGQKPYVPGVIQLFEFGAIGPQSVLPFVRGTMGGPQNTYRSLQWLNMNWTFAYSASGYMDYGMPGALQVDPYGNITSTFLGGTIRKPERRFAGSGGGNQAASHCWKTIIVIKHEGRRFVPRVDFLTSPGYLTGPGAREKPGLPAGTGPYRVVTSKALFGFDEETRLLREEIDPSRFLFRGEKMSAPV
jgi:acyl CoA:acetate/3-ketoacid CoA transferase beta subunit